MTCLPCNDGLAAVLVPLHPVTFKYIVAQLQEKKITLLKIKDMIFGRKSEKNKKEKEKAGKGRAH